MLIKNIANNLVTVYINKNEDMLNETYETSE